MKNIFSFTRYNSPFDDSVLYVRQLNSSEDLLFDLGDISKAPSSHILRVKKVFISHTHMDHFAGIHNFIRIVLKTGKEIEIYGPENIANNVYGALSSYTWNLIEDFDLNFSIYEIIPGKINKYKIRSSNFFKPLLVSEVPLNDKIICDDAFYKIKVDFFYHKTTVLGFRLEEKDTIAVNKKSLLNDNLESGPWIGEAKRGILSNQPLDQAILSPIGPLKLGIIKEKYFFKKKHNVYVYLTDFGMTKENYKRAVNLSKGAYILYIESNFLHKDIELAKETQHLTAFQAGFIARVSGVEFVRLMHFSKRYLQVNGFSEDIFYDEMEKGKR